ncbi:MAG: hypothetical protein ABIA76_04040 [Candidatus Diapherotrites archaeon]
MTKEGLVRALRKRNVHYAQHLSPEKAVEAWLRYEIINKGRPVVDTNLNRFVAQYNLSMEVLRAIRKRVTKERNNMVEK